MPTTSIREGYTTLTPMLIVYDGARAIDFYKRAFGAEEVGRLADPNGRLMHADLKIGDTHLMLCDEMREYGALAPTALGGTSTTIHMYVENADEAFERAVLAGAAIVMPPADMFWGDRYSKVTDPFGHSWSIAHRIGEFDQKAFEQMMKEGAGCGSDA